MQENVAPVSTDDFGFVRNEDVAKLHPVHPQKKAPSHVPHETPPDEDEAMNKNQEKHFKVNLRHKDHSSTDDDEEKNIEDEAQNKSRSFKPPLFNIAAYFNKIKLPGLKSLSSGGNKKFLKPLIFLALIIIFCISIMYMYLYKVSAQVVLSVRPQEVEQKEDVIFSTTSPSDFSKNIIAAKKVSTSIEGELSTNATGKKPVGDKAKGSVTIFSKLTQAKTFTAGTTVKGNGLEFTFDKDVNVASSSGDASTSPSTATVAVTAKEIGKESNLPSGVKFNVGNFDQSDVVAKNDSAFSGGTKKEITVVSKDDIAKLKTDLPKTLEQKGKDELSKKATDSEPVLPVLSSPKLDKTTFDKDVGDEAKKVKLKGTVVFQGISYQNEELMSFAKSLLKNHYSEDISFAENSVKPDLKDAKQKNEKEIEAVLKVNAGLLPKIDTLSVVKKIEHKSLKQAKETLATLPQVEKSDIKFTPSIPLLPSLLPFLPKNISVQIATN